MDLTSKSLLLSGLAALGVRPGVRPLPTAAALGSSRIRGAPVPPARKRFAGRALAALVFAAAAGLAACDPEVRGNGVAFEKTLTLDPFEGVRIETGVAAIVTVDPAIGAQTVKLVGDENLVADGHILAGLEPDGVGSVSVTVLRVRVESGFVPTIQPKVVIGRPTFTFAHGQNGGTIELRRPPGSAAVGGPLAVWLEGASLQGSQYPTERAAVLLTGGSTAHLHSDGPVTGSVSADSHLDNTAGAGPCLVVTTAAGSVSCH